MILSSQSLMKRRNLIQPFNRRTISHGMTFGLGPAGYDIRINDDAILWPGRFLLADSMEKFEMDCDVLAYVKDKSTWARRGICVQNTVIEPGWRGVLRLEITNHSWNFFKIKKGMPIAQIVFHKLDEPTDMSYRGKYQDQKYKQNAILEGNFGEKINERDIL